MNSIVNWIDVKEGSEWTGSPVVKCRACRRILAADYQPGLMRGSVGCWLVTCWSVGCRMNGYTLAASEYAALDLTVYGALGGQS